MIPTQVHEKSRRETDMGTQRQAMGYRQGPKSLIERSVFSLDAASNGCPLRARPEPAGTGGTAQPAAGHRLPDAEGQVGARLLEFEGEASAPLRPLVLSEFSW